MMTVRTLTLQSLKRFPELAVSFELPSCLTTVSTRPRQEKTSPQTRCSVCSLVHTCTSKRNGIRNVDDNTRTADCVKSQTRSCTYNVDRIASLCRRSGMIFKKEFSSHCKPLNAEDCNKGRQQSDDTGMDKLVNRLPVEETGDSLSEKDDINHNFNRSLLPDVSHDAVLEDTIGVPESRKPCTDTEDELLDSGDPQSEVDDVDNNTYLQTRESEDLSDYTPLSKTDHTYANFGPLVEKSEVLSTLLLFGVNLWKIQKKRRADIFLRLDLQQDVAPVLLVLHQAGFQDSDLSTVFTKYPQIFKEAAEDIEVRLNYLISKKFKKEDTISIVKAMPSILSTPTVKTDSALGFYQKFFRLKGADLRHAMITYPRLIQYDQDTFKYNCYILKKGMGFQTDELKNMFVQAPQIFILGKFQDTNYCLALCILHRLSSKEVLRFLNDPNQNNATKWTKAK